jgi:threonine dehydrogenase-like Zn-dependent dehydrogenase
MVRERAVQRAARVLPPHLSDEAAVFVEPAACVLRGLSKAGLPGPDQDQATPSTVVILGAGSMGLLHVLMVRAVLPLTRAVISDPLPDRRRLGEQLGAMRAVTPAELAGAVSRVSRGLGADAVFDTVGHPQTIREGLEMLRSGGSLILFAHGDPEDRIDFELNRFFKHEQRLVGTYSGSLQEQKQVFELLSDGRLDPSPLITHRRPLQRFDEAVQLVRARQGLKVLLTTRGEDRGAKPA